MEIHLKYTNLEPGKDLKSYIQKKLGFLTKLILPVRRTRSELGESVHAWIEVGRVTRHHQAGKVWYAECQLRWPGQSLRATSTNYDLGAALDEVKDRIEFLLQKDRKRQTGQIRRRRAAKRHSRDRDHEPRQ